jgi:hypothetical protein
VAEPETPSLVVTNDGADVEDVPPMSVKDQFFSSVQLAPLSANHAAHRRLYN